MFAIDLMWDMYVKTFIRLNVANGLQVQSMSFIAGVLLLNMSTLDAFIAFANLMNRPLQRTFFGLRQPQMTYYFIAYDQYFKVHLPKLHAHFDALDIRPDVYLIEWYECDVCHAITAGCTPCTPSHCRWTLRRGYGTSTSATTTTCSSKRLSVSGEQRMIV